MAAPRQLVLKVDVDSLRGTLEGVPRLAECFARHGADATFLFSLGPDHTGRAIRRIFRPDFAKKVHRTSVVSRYGVRTLLYGTLLPGPDIGRLGAMIMRSTRERGFETGIHCWDYARWQNGVVDADAAWTAREMVRAVKRFRELFAEAPLAHGAAGWQMNVHALRLGQRLGFRWASDTRGTHPFVPVYNAEVIRCPQYPTTLPTLDELMGVDDLDDTTVSDRLLAMTGQRLPSPQVFTLHAELAGAPLLPMLDTLLAGWRRQGWELVSLRRVAERTPLTELPRHSIEVGEVPGRSGTVWLQGAPFPGQPGEA